MEKRAPKILRKKWLSIQKMPDWAKEYVRFGLIKNAIFTYLDRSNSKTFAFEANPTDLIELLKCLDVNITEEEANKAIKDYQVGIEYLDDILYRMGILSHQD